MLNANEARKALQYNFFPNAIKVGSPQPFIKGYDNYTGGAAAIANFNLLMQSPKHFPIKGNFGRPLTAQNLQSTYPTYNATWTASTFEITGGGLTRTWIGSAVIANDTTIEIDTLTNQITGSIVDINGIAYGTISGTASTPGADFWTIVSANVQINFLQNIFYGDISWGMTNDNLGTTNNQILINSYSDLLGQNYSVSLNAVKTLCPDPVLVPFDSAQGQLIGTASTVYFAGKNNIFFSGYIFPLSNQ